MPIPAELSVVRGNPIEFFKNKQKRLFFVIYYVKRGEGGSLSKNEDLAFKRAAKWWGTETRLTELFIPGYDEFLEREVTTEGHFKSVWNEIAAYAEKRSLTVWAGNIFSHAWKDQDGGLSFRDFDEENGILTRLEIHSLKKLPWNNKYGYLILSSCNSALIGARGWCSAQAFAKQQGVITVGQKGYAYFSTTWEKYTRISRDSRTVYLWAYDRSDNYKSIKQSIAEGVVTGPIIGSSVAIASVIHAKTKFARRIAGGIYKP